MALQLFDESMTSEYEVQLADGFFAVTVDGKEQAIALRQKLVRRGWVCTFPIATWDRSRFELHVSSPSGASIDALKRLIGELLKSN